MTTRKNAIGNVKVLKMPHNTTAAENNKLKMYTRTCRDINSSENGSNLSAVPCHFYGQFSDCIIKECNSWPSARIHIA